MNRTIRNLTIATLLVGASLQAKTYATVDGDAITEQNIAVLMQSFPGNATYDKLPEAQQKKVLEQAVEQKLLSKHALKNKELTDSDVYKELLQGAKEKIALELWMKGQLESLNISDKDAKAFFDSNKDKFVKPERVKARHILLKTEDEAKDVIKELQSAGKKSQEKFIDLAKSKSTGPSGKNGGDLGWFQEGQMVPEFSKEAFSLKPGTFSSKPVQTKFGYHVVLVEEKEAQEDLKFDEVKERIQKSLKMQQFRDSIAKYAEDLKKKAKISYK